MPVHPAGGARLGRAAILAAVLLSVLVSGCGQRGGKTAAVAMDQAIPVAVTTASVGAIENTLTIPGRIVARQEAVLSAKVPGRVSAVLVSLGDRVRRGQALVRLESGDQAAQVAQARAAWESARANRERMRLLYEEGAISRQQWEQAELQLTQASVALDMARSALASATITAPFDGWVTSLPAAPGALASPGVPLLTIADTSRLYLEGSLTDTHAARIKPGQEVRVETEALPGASFRGAVEAVAPAADGQRRTFPVRIGLLDPPPELKAGMFARATVALERRAGAVLLPVEALLGQEGSARYVYVVDGGVARRQAVETGLSDGVHVEVRRGLRPGAQVVVSGQHYLRDGAPVRIAGEER